MANLNEQIKTLRSLATIRERCTAVHTLATQDKLHYFVYHPEKEADVVAYCVNIMKRDYPDFNKVSIRLDLRWQT